MKVILLVVSVCLLGMSSVAFAGSRETERLWQRIDQLEAENFRLRGQVRRLQEQRVLPSRAPYRNSSLYDATRSLDEVNRLKNSWERLRR
jgi:HAMP domain-containing protein